MKEILTTVTRRGQVTVPAKVLQLLRTRSTAKVALQIENGEVRLAAASITLESACRSVEPIGRPEDFNRIERQAKAEHIARQVRKTQRS